MAFNLLLQIKYIQLHVTQVICFAILDDEQSKLEGSGSGLDSYLPELAKVITFLSLLPFIERSWNISYFLTLSRMESIEMINN